MKFIYPHKSKILIFSLVIILGVISAIAVRKLQTSGSDSENDFGKVIFMNQLLPEVNFIDYKNKTNYNLKLRNGKVLLIYILTDCKGCQMESEIIAQSDLAKNSEITIFAVSKEGEVSVNEFTKNHNFNFPILFDENEQLREKLNITAFPANFVINNGVIEKSWIGSPRNVEELKGNLEITPDK